MLYFVDEGQSLTVIFFLLNSRNSNENYFRKVIYSNDIVNINSLVIIIVNGTTMSVRSPKHVVIVKKPPMSNDGNVRFDGQQPRSSTICVGRRWTGRTDQNDDVFKP